MTDHEIITALPQCVLVSESIRKSTWEQLFKAVKLIGKSMNIAVASRGPVTLVLDRVQIISLSCRVLELHLIWMSHRATSLYWFALTSCSFSRCKTQLLYQPFLHLSVPRFQGMFYTEIATF